MSTSPSVVLLLCLTTACSLHHVDGQDEIPTDVSSCNATNKCPRHYKCFNGMCRPTCASLRCPVNQTCVIKPDHSHSPDYPTPVCHPNNNTHHIYVKDPCAPVNCPANTMCKDTACVPPTCDSLKCDVVETCSYIFISCLYPSICYPIPICISANKTDPITEMDKCAGVRCVRNFSCINGTCIPPTCESLNCSIGQKCAYLLISCIDQIPCNPIPVCVAVADNNPDPIPGTNRCDFVRCRGDATCINGTCVPATCEGKQCYDWEKCELVVVDCSYPGPCYPVPMCMVANQTGLVLGKDTGDIMCPVNTAVMNGTCVPYTCESFVCGSGQTCVLQDVDCVTTPCFPIPTCVPINTTPEPFNKCALVLCATGTKCIDGECFPLTCDNKTCKPGQTCKLVEIECFATPCPPSIPTCMADPTAPSVQVNTAINY